MKKKDYEEFEKEKLKYIKENEAVELSPTLEFEVKLWEDNNYLNERIRVLKDLYDERIKERDVYKAYNNAWIGTCIVLGCVIIGLVVKIYTP